MNSTLLSILVSLAFGLTAIAAPLSSDSSAGTLDNSITTATDLFSGVSSGTAAGQGASVDTSGSVFSAPSARPRYDYSEMYGHEEEDQEEFEELHLDEKRQMLTRREGGYAYGYNKSPYGCDTEDGYGLDGWDQEYDEHCRHVPHLSHERRGEEDVEAPVPTLVKRHGFEVEGEDEEDDEDKWDDDGFGYLYQPDGAGVHRRVRIG